MFPLHIAPPPPPLLLRIIWICYEIINLKCCLSNLDDAISPFRATQAWVLQQIPLQNSWHLIWVKVNCQFCKSAPSEKQYKCQIYQVLQGVRNCQRKLKFCYIISNVKCDGWISSLFFFLLIINLVYSCIIWKGFRKHFKSFLKSFFKIIIFLIHFLVVIAV